MNNAQNCDIYIYIALLYMWYEWGRRETCIGYWQESQRERDH
jgi:hypothetical protein